MAGMGTVRQTPEEFISNFNTLNCAMGFKNVAIGTDVNGFEPLPKSSTNTNYFGFYSNFEKSSLGNKEWDYSTDGVAHYGLMNDFFRDLELNQTQGNQVIESLEKSAEYFAKMWEKCERNSRNIE